jgi:hypothetical protein
MQGSKKDNKIRDVVRDEFKRIHSEVRWNNNRAFHTATKPEDVQVYLDNQEPVFKDLAKLCALEVNGTNMVKLVKTKSEALPHIELVDLKLNVYGPIED